MLEKINPFRRGGYENTQKCNKNIAIYDKDYTDLAENCRCGCFALCNYTKINKDKNSITKTKQKKSQNFSFRYLTNGDVCTIFSHA